VLQWTVKNADACEHADTWGLASSFHNRCWRALSRNSEPEGWRSERAGGLGIYIDGDVVILEASRNAGRSDCS
jgi:hypothetical protein